MSTSTQPPPTQKKPGDTRAGDRLFARAAAGTGILILVLLAAVATFLLIEGFPAFTASPEEIPGDGGIWRFIGTLLFGTVVAATLALLIAAPLSVGIALFITHYAPRRISAFLGYIVDLLAAVPSVIFGLWGFAFVAQNVKGVFPWLADNLGFLPFFGDPVNTVGTSMLTVGIVLAVMIMPIMTAVNREVFLQTPRLQEEAALALGATRFEMIKMTVLPHARSGIVSGSMLGLGRALGETIAVALVLSAVPGVVTLNLIGQSNPSTVAANIALKFPEYSGIEVNALIASGLALFLLTFFVNFAARAIVNRRSAFSGADA